MPRQPMAAGLLHIQLEHEHLWLIYLRNTHCELIQEAPPRCGRLAASGPAAPARPHASHLADAPLPLAPASMSVSPPPKPLMPVDV